MFIEETLKELGFSSEKELNHLVSEVDLNWQFNPELFEDDEGG